MDSKCHELLQIGKSSFLVSFARNHYLYKTSNFKQLLTYIGSEGNSSNMEFKKLKRPIIPESYWKLSL